MLLSEGQMSDFKGAALMIDTLPSAKAMLGDRGYDANWFRRALTARGITPCFHTRYDRCAHTFMSANCIAATVIFWLWSMSHELS